MNPNVRRLNAHVSAQLFSDLEDLRHERSKAAGQRVTLRELLQEALRDYLSEARATTGASSSSENRHVE